MAESLGDGRAKNRDDMETKEAVGTSSVEIASIEDGGIPECAVCLQTCVHPCRLPCGHIFCFLCIKGTVATTHPGSVRRCAMCRREIPPDFLDKPTLLRPILPAISANPSICGIRESSNSLNSELSDDQRSNDREGYLWFYEGRNGWWQYDERTSLELEVAYKRGERSCELLIAGFLYIADFDAMLQLRRGDPSRRRRIKRDLASIPIKGVAGLRQKVPPLLHDGDDSGQTNQSTTCSMHQASVNDDRGIFLQTSWYQDEHLTQIPPTPVNTPGNTSPGNASTPSAGSASVVASDTNTELSLRHTMEEMGRLHLGECTRVSSSTSGQRDEGESCADDRLSGRENSRTASVLWSPVSPDIASASPWVLTLSSDEDQL